MNRLYPFFVALAFPFLVYSQSNPRLPFFDDPLPKTPEVNSLFRYSPQSFGNTGKITVSVPIYTVAVDGIQLPIVLGYQNDGLKVAELSSRVGHGWTMTAGGSISRQVRGLPDETDNGMLNPTIRQKAKDYTDNNMSLSAKNTYLGRVAIGLDDSEFDIFNFQAGPLSGSFFIDINGSVRVFSARDIKVTYDNNFNQFTIVDEGGNTYLFAEKEQTNRGVTEGYVWQISGTSAWHISSIQTYQGKTISFSYEFESFVRNEYRRTDKFRHISSLGEPCSSASGIIPYQSEVTQNPKQLSVITFPMGKLVFTRGAVRQDVTDYSDDTAIPSYQSRTLASIELRDYQNTLLKTYELGHGYFGTTGNRRLKLQSVTEKSQGQVAQVHSFEYYNEAALFPNTKYVGQNQANLPDSYFSQDHWGYYNGKVNQTLIPTINMQSVNSDLDASSRSSQADRRSDGNYAQYGMLQRMTLPTRGTVTYEYEMNRVYYGDCTSVPLFLKQDNTSGGNQNCDQPYFVGGMRVKKETACPDGNNSNCINRVINYETVNGPAVTNSAELYAIPEYRGNASFFLCQPIQQQQTEKDTTQQGNVINDRPEGCPQFGGCIEYTCNSTTLSDHNLSSIGYGNIIEYPRIEVLDGLGGEAGKTISWYNLSSTQGIRLFPYPVVWVKTWEGTLKTQIAYRNFGGTFKPITKTENAYATDEINGNKYDVSNKVGVVLSNPSYVCQDYKVNDQFLGQPFHRLSQNTVTEYTHDGNGNLTDSIKVFQSFFHENLANHLQLTRSVTDYPGIQKEDTFYSYPKDFIIFSLNDEEIKGMKDLQNRNRQVPLETYTKSYDHTGTFTGYASAQTLTHTLRNGKAFPYELFRLKAPTATFSPVFYLVRIVKDENYEREMQYQQYDAENNMVQQMSKSQMVQSFVYAYPSRSRLIMEGKNVTHDNILGVNGSLPFYGIGDENTIHNAGDVLRTNFSNALIQSIAHRPMVGVVSMARPNNLKTSFGYDAFLRLRDIKDPNGNLTDYFRYVYPSGAVSFIGYGPNSCNNFNGTTSSFQFSVTGLAPGTFAEFSTDNVNYSPANVGNNAYMVDVPYSPGLQNFWARPSDNPGQVIFEQLQRCAFTGTTPAPTISVTNSTLCNANLTATGCSGTVNWSNGGSGSSIAVATTTSTAYSATCTDNGATSSASSPLTVPTLPSPWNSADIGNPATGCTQAGSGSSLTLLGNGLVGGSGGDSYHGINRQITGDFTIIARISAIPSDPSDDGDRSGIMIRSSNAPDAKYYTLIQDANGNVGELKRDVDGGTGGLYSYKPSPVNQTWIRVIKTGSSIKGYHSTNSDPEANNAWDPDFFLTGTNPTILDFGSSCLINFVTWGNANQTTFTNITINGQPF